MIVEQLVLKLKLFRWEKSIFLQNCQVFTCVKILFIRMLARSKVWGLFFHLFQKWIRLRLSFLPRVHSNFYQNGNIYSQWFVSWILFSKWSFKVNFNVDFWNVWNYRNVEFFIQKIAISTKSWILASSFLFFSMRKLSHELQFWSTFLCNIWYDFISIASNLPFLEIVLHEIFSLM